MIKKLAIIMSAMTVSMLLNGMENVLELKSLKRTTTVEKGSESRRPEGSQPDIRLNLGNLPEPLLSASNGKPSIKSLKQVPHLKSQQNTLRDASTGRDRNDGKKEKRSILESVNDNKKVTVEGNQLLPMHDNNDAHEEGIGETNILQQDGLRQRNKRRSVLGELSPHNTPYSSQDMWDLVKKVNPKMYDYATENHLSLDEVMNCTYDFDAINPQIYILLKKLSKKKSLPLNLIMEYALLSDENNIEPEAIGELLQLLHEYSDDHTALLVKELKKLAEKNPDEYLSIAVDFVTRTCDDGGLKELSPINKTHAAIQKNMITEERSDKYKLLAALVAVAIPALSALPGWILGIIGLVNNSTHTG